LGYPVKGINKIHPKALQSVLSKAKGTAEETIISKVMLQSLAKARYSHQNLGHFGLAAKFYCHFTSPIRRYPDLIIHRLMKEYMKGNVPRQRDEYLRDKLPEIARHCSERERNAEDAERDTEDLKKVEYMKSKEGEVFEGTISNVTSFGMFVELDNTAEGLVRMSSMDDDYYIFDEKRYCLVGERTIKVYRIGEKVVIRVARADIESRQLDFILEENYHDAEDEEKLSGSKAAGKKKGKNTSKKGTAKGSGRKVRRRKT
jgi:ribonuclease R